MQELKYNLEELQKKAKERTVKTQNIEYSPEMLLKRVDNGEIKINPEYQRRHRWTPEISSRLIESLILNIPIPLIYLSQDIDIDEETKEGIARYSIIDGQQRVTAIINFFKNEYPLTSLEVLKELEGNYFKDLPPFLVRRLEDRSIKFLRVDSTADSKVKYDIFERLNSGSVHLEPQELRNSIYRGKFNDLIKELSVDENFRKLLQIDSNEHKKVKKMEDVELVLRFFALSNNDGYKNVKQGIVHFLSEAMKNFNKLNNEELEELKDKFKKVMEVILKFFDDKAFAKYNARKITPFNTSVYDALSIAVAKEVDLDNPNIPKEKIEKFKDLFKNDEDNKFFISIDNNTTDSQKIIYIIDRVRKILSNGN